MTGARATSGATRSEGGPAGAGRGPEGADVEMRRFRTWEQDTPHDPENAWRTVARYAVLRAFTNWPTMMLHVLALLFAVVVIGSLSYGLRFEGVYDGYAGAPADVVHVGLALFAVPAGAMLLWIGAPMFSEDLRFNAPLFYFAKPLRTRHYMQGKVLHLAATLAAVSYVPILLFLLVIPVLGFPDAPTSYIWDDTPLDPEELHFWEVETISSFGEWTYVMGIVTFGAAVVLAWTTSVVSLVSTYTRRAWHAAMSVVALVGGWGMLGLVASDSFRNAYGNLTGPFGWLNAVLFLPLELEFSLAANPMPGDAAFYGERFAGAWPTFWLAHLILIATTVLFLWLTLRRLRRLEAIL